jgi:hypothetical protein
MGVLLWLVMSQNTKSKGKSQKKNVVFLRFSNCPALRSRFPLRSNDWQLGLRSGEALIASRRDEKARPLKPGSSEAIQLWKFT